MEAREDEGSPPLRQKVSHISTRAHSQHDTGQSSPKDTPRYCLQCNTQTKLYPESWMQPREWIRPSDEDTGSLELLTLYDIWTSESSRFPDDVKRAAVLRESLGSHNDVLQLLHDNAYQEGIEGALRVMIGHPLDDDNVDVHINSAFTAKSFNEIANHFHLPEYWPDSLLQTWPSGLSGSFDKMMSEEDDEGNGYAIWTMQFPCVQDFGDQHHFSAACSFDKRRGSNFVMIDSLPRSCVEKELQVPLQALKSHHAHPLLTGTLLLEIFTRWCLKEQRSILVLISDIEKFTTTLRKRPIYPRVPLSDVSPNTLAVYGLPWEYIGGDDPSVAILRTLYPSEIEELKDYTQQHRVRKAHRNLMPTAVPKYPKIRRTDVADETLNYYGVPWKEDTDSDYVLVRQEMSEEEIELLLQHTFDLRQTKLPVYPKIRRTDIADETLNHFKLPWEYDLDPDYIVIPQEMSVRQTDMLFKHTWKLRERDRPINLPNHQTSSPSEVKAVVSESTKGYSNMRPTGQDSRDIQLRPKTKAIPIEFVPYQQFERDPQKGTQSMVRMPSSNNMRLERATPLSEKAKSNSARDSLNFEQTSKSEMEPLGAKQVPVDPYVSVKREEVSPVADRSQPSIPPDEDLHPPDNSSNLGLSTNRPQPSTPSDEDLHSPDSSLNLGLSIRRPQLSIPPDEDVHSSDGSSSFGLSSNYKQTWERHPISRTSITDQLENLAEQYNAQTRRLGDITKSIANLRDMAVFGARFAQFLLSENDSIRAQLSKPHCTVRPTSCEFLQYRIENSLRSCDGLLQAIEGLNLRSQSQTALLYSLISQHDSETSARIATSSEALAMDSKRDSSAMKSLSVVTMIFLPATFVASLFSTDMLSWQVEPGQFVSPQFWIYWVVSIPLTLLVILVWDEWTRWRREDDGLTARGETLPLRKIKRSRLRPMLESLQELYRRVPTIEFRVVPKLGKASARKTVRIVDDNTSTFSRQTVRIRRTVDDNSSTFSRQTVRIVDDNSSTLPVGREEYVGSGASPAPRDSSARTRGKGKIRSVFRRRNRTGEDMDIEHGEEPHD